VGGVVDGGAVMGEVQNFGSCFVLYVNRLGFLMIFLRC
jgi:hypothetical protein